MIAPFTIAAIPPEVPWETTTLRRPGRDAEIDWPLGELLIDRGDDTGNAWAQIVLSQAKDV